jgi:hypothetical protein
MLPFLIRQLYGRSIQVLEPKLFLVGWVIWCRQVFLSGPELLVCGQLQTPTTHRAILGARIMLFWSMAFLLGIYQFHLTTSFSQVVKCVVFRTVAGPHCPPRRLDQLSFPPHPHQAEVKWSLRLFGQQICPGWVAICPPAALDLWFPQSG